MRLLYLPNSYSQQRQFQKKANIYPVLMAMEAQKYRNEGHEVYWNINRCPKCKRKYTIKTWFTLLKHPAVLQCSKCKWEFDLNEFDKIITEPEGLSFLSLPHPDRVFTGAKEYTSGNYKYLPGTHMQVANGCWWGKCSFCVENGKPYEVRSVDDVIEEIKEIKQLGFKEVFDDSGTFPTGQWLLDFCNLLNDINFSCNMRLVDNDYKKMKQVGFRMLLFGIESANQNTLDKINKGVKVDDIIPTIRKAAEAGLEPHISCIFGWEWETEKEALNTLRLVWWLLRKGYAKTAQASFIVQQGIKGNESQRHFINDIYGVWKYPDFWFSQLKDIKDKDDLKYLWRKIKAGLNV